MTDDPDKLDDFVIDNLGEEDERGETVTVYELRCYRAADTIRRTFLASGDDDAIGQAEAWIRSFETYSSGEPRGMFQVVLDCLIYGRLNMYGEHGPKGALWRSVAYWNRDGNRTEGGATCK